MIALEHEADRAWMDRAACRGHDPELWYPTQGMPPAQARAICGACPVRDPCADYADTHGERHGVWGGMSVDERYRRARQRAAVTRWS